MNTLNIKQKAISSVAWTAIQKYSSIILQLISGIILARLLTPYDYGCIGMLSIFITLASSFIDGGFGSALIQKKNPTQKDYSTIFFWNMSISILLYIILYFSAPAIANFYNISILNSVLRVQALVLIVNAFTLVQSNQLRKNLNFKLITIVSLITIIFSLSITIIMAYNGFGVWALVTQNLISAIIPALIYWFYIKWRPQWTFSWASFKELFNFGFYMLLTHLMNNLGKHVQGLLIGKIYSPATMGYYSKAHSTESLAASSISSIISQVTYPLYVQVQDNIQTMSNMIRKFCMVISYITFPLILILILTAKPIFLFLFSERWLPSVPYFQALCVAGMIDSLMAVNLQPIAAIGKSKTMFIWTIIKRCVGLGFIVIGTYAFGMKGLICGILLNTIFSYFINIMLVSKHIGYKWYKQLLDLSPVSIISLISLCISYFTVSIFRLDIYIDGIIKFLIFVTIYIILSIFFKLEAYSYTISIISTRFNFLKKKRVL